MFLTCRGEITDYNVLNDFSKAPQYQQQCHHFNQSFNQSINQWFFRVALVTKITTRSTWVL